MKRILSLLLAVCLLLSAVPFAAAAEAPTEEAAYEAMIAYKEIYPEGTPWGDTQYYEWNGGIYAGGTGCVAFAFMLSDAAFGDLPARMVETVVFSEVRVGDILRMDHDTHSVIVLETHEDYVVLAEGSYNNAVHWGRILTVEQVEGSDFLLTRYPEGTGDDDGPTDSIIPDDAVVLGTGSCGDKGLPNVKWTLCEDGTLYLTGMGPTQQYVYDHPGWYDNAGLVTKVVVQDGITDIGSGTFANHTALTQVILPDSVTKIGLEAFMSCTALTSCDLPAALETIDSRAFLSCTALTNLTFPESLKTINISAFSGSGLKNVTLPEGLTYLGNNCFENCLSLKKLYIPGSVNNNSQYLCQGCSALEQVTFGEGLRSIGRYSFDSCGNLKNVTFPSTLKDIGEYAFYESGVEELTLPDGLEEIGDYAFQSCSSLETVSIPDSVTAFGNYVFSGCEALGSVTIAEGIEDLGNGTFEGCDVLDTITLPASLKRIGAYLFASSGLTWMEIPGGVTEIGAYAFEQNDYLQVLTIPSSVTWMGQLIADRCEKLPCIYFDGTRQQYDAITFQGSALDRWYQILFVDQSRCAHTSTTTLYQIPATCDSYGVTEGTLCAACGKVLKAPELITELGHNWSEWVALDAYTERRTCSYCHRSETRQIPQPKHPFVDVEAGAFYEESVIWAVENDITSGTDATHFSPNGICNRAQVVTFLWRAAGCPAPTSTKHSFVDVQAGSFYETAVLWAVEKGITTGTDATHFSPNAACNRATVVTFLWRAAKCPEPASGTNPFSDVPAVSWYTEPVLWAVENGITNGLSATQFGPNASCNRAQVVTFLYRAFAE